MRALLDVNVLIALLDAAHIHHSLAKQWLLQEIEHGWASCPITQNGCIRILSSPAYPGDFTPSEVASKLFKAMAHPAHAFWPDDLSLCDESSIAWQHLLGHKQITDAYLLGLATKNQGRFVTFDKRITWQMVSGAKHENLEIIRK
ncbi:MAG: DNA-binding protein [Methylothermaceae bacteria B42]|nr:MAG: DNA-binding protein [Methylothermaceae bacteria B42]HHJ37919.1 VapC toxin family PIN domain ribonuclease [Methylothermaceae bacterium]